MNLNNDYAQAWLAQNANFDAEKPVNPTIINTNQGHNSTKTTDVLNQIINIQSGTSRTDDHKLREINSVIAENIGGLCFNKADTHCMLKNEFNLGLLNLNLTFTCENDSNHKRLKSCTNLENVYFKTPRLKKNKKLNFIIPPKAQESFKNHLGSLYSPQTIENVIRSRISNIYGFELPTDHRATFSSVVLPLPIEGETGRFKIDLNLPNHTDNWVVGVYDTAGDKVNITVWDCGSSQIRIQSGSDNNQKNWAMTGINSKTQESMPEQFKDYLKENDGIVVFGVPFEKIGYTHTYDQVQYVPSSKAFKPRVGLTHGGRSDPHHYGTKVSTDEMNVKDGSFVTFIKPYPINIQDEGFWKGYSNYGTYCTEKNLTEFMQFTKNDIYPKNMVNAQNYIAK